MLKFTLSLAAICLSVTTLFAQKLEKPQIDKIKSDTVWKTSEERIYTHLTMSSGEALYAYALKVKTSFVLVLKVEIMNGPTTFSVTEDDITNVKFTDNTVIDLKPFTPDGSYAQTKFLTGGTKTAAVVFYELSDENLQQLKNKSISIVRIATKGASNLDFELKPKNSDTIKKEFELVTAIK